MTAGTVRPGAVRPMIGITGRRVRLGLVEGLDSRYGHLLADTFMSDFAERIARAGGVPVNLPYDADPEALCHWMSGMVITGGQDVHPACWGGDPSVVRNVDPRSDPMVHDAERDQFELALVRAALDRRIPVLGVCRGLQILNIALGGTLIPHLSPGSVEHLSASPPLTDGADDHKVTFEPGSIAEQIFGASAVTNSWHHQAVDRCGTGLVITGRTADGVVEAVELPGSPVLGVQWHPEWMEHDDPALSWVVTEAHKRI
ncbi:gamma-glutamyl-gamma-aminobutyrate hydrolase family protein [Mycolicibacterium sp. KC 300]|uniref:Gamma-glutamyl-gamma-aminobutyrate hydrolase family protein n=2 Tax=Mycolicibacterium arseniciresistens TaxID=3062257 RepID=A0ABT8UN94_9MYCO|nr:gamma-glutamyl-gamma-aminobutyrate hydrolase family protein [Mycolicibacterium arseniciresistens]MDO3638621.1 gamma-glutamyl-gamma-aminobutyrate hydrolase family protein [Mycolicibacterium arseniciresistens]